MYVKKMRPLSSVMAVIRHSAGIVESMISGAMDAGMETQKHSARHVTQILK
jgi:hypothetical protein